MCAIRRKDSALSRRIKDLEKELESVGGEIKTLSRVVRKAERAGPVQQVSVPGPVQKELAQEQAAVQVRQESRMQMSVLSKQPVEYSQPRVQGDSVARKPLGDKDQITRDGRFATYLMSRDFHNVRPLRHEKYIQRNKAIVMVVVAVVILLYLVMRFIP